MDRSTKTIIIIVVIIVVIIVLLLLLLLTVVNPKQDLRKPKYRLKCKSLMSDMPSVSYKKYIKNKKLYDNNYTEYRNINRRDPPHGYDKWIEWAAGKGANLSPSFYQQIQIDMLPFRAKDGSSEPTLDYTITETIVEMIGSNHTELLTLAELPDYYSSWESFRHLLPASLKFVLNTYDEPRSLPSDVCNNGNCSYSTKTMNEVYNQSKCMRDNYSKSELPASHTAYFHFPSTFVNIPQSLPIFSQTKLKCNHDILLPGSYNYIGERFNDPIPWNQKQNIVHWRGSTTGGEPLSINDLKYFQRFNLIQWAKINSNRSDLGFSVDIGFSGITNYGKLYEEYNNMVDVMPRVEMIDSFKFKYLIVIEGNTFVSRLPILLHSKSLIFFSGPFLEWYTLHLKPWIHYIPFKLDFSDLTDMILWALKNDNEAKKIAERGELLIKTHCRKIDMDAYSALALMEYAALIKV